MRVHPREQNVRRAGLAIRTAINDAVKKEELTESEIISVVAGACGDYLTSLARLLIRVERHGNTDKPGGIE